MFHSSFLFLSKCRYELLSSFIVLLAIAFVFNGQWKGDFYEHAAVVRELSTHPIKPKNPLILSNAPHAFYSPYTLFLGLITRVFKISAIQTLSCAAILNLCLLLFSLRLFILNHFKKDQSKVSFYTVLLFLFFWGSNPWWYSGFLHMDVLFYVLPYPSTFTTALAFTSFACYSMYIKKKKTLLILLILILLTICFITHPVTTLSSYVVLILLSIDNEWNWTEFLSAVAICAVSTLLSVLWPYYPILKLLIYSTPATVNFHLDNKELYENILGIIWPFILFAPTLFIKHVNRSRSLLFALALLVLIYISGYIFKIWGLGRVICFAASIYHILVALQFARLENYVLETQKSRLISLACLLFIIVLSKKFYYPIINSIPVKTPYYSKFNFLSKYINQYDVVLSDIGTSFFIPSFGGKVIASPHPLYFVSDHRIRREDLGIFFKDITLEKREEIIKKYLVKFILLDNTNQNIDLASFGDLIYKDNNFSLIRINLGNTKN